MDLAAGLKPSGAREGSHRDEVALSPRGDHRIVTETHQACENSREIGARAGAVRQLAIPGHRRSARIRRE